MIRRGTKEEGGVRSWQERQALREEVPPEQRPLPSPTLPEAEEAGSGLRHWVGGAVGAGVGGGRRSNRKAWQAPHWPGMRPREQWVVITQAGCPEERRGGGGSRTAPEKSAAEPGAGSPPPTWGTSAGEAREGRQSRRDASASGSGLWRCRASLSRPPSSPCSG